MHSNEELDPEQTLIRRIIAVLRRRDDLPFEEAVRQYRQIESEFVALAGDDEGQVAYTKRSITNHLLIHAEMTEQPHEVCKDIWEELMQRGFWNIEMRHVTASTYARCCQFNGEFNAGLAVLEPLIVELEQRLEDTTLTSEIRHYYKMTLDSHRRLRDKLEAGIRI